MNTKASNEAILERFKKTYQNDEHFVLDAWLEEVGGEAWIKYQLNTDIADLDPEAQTKKMVEVPAEFEGIPTIITWWPKE